MTTSQATDGVGTQIARALTASMKKHYGRGPVSAKAHFLEDDVLVVVMREPATTAEQTMARAGREKDARDFRLAFQDAYAGELRGIVEDLTGRTVATYHSQIIFKPDMLFEIFVFDPVSAQGTHPSDARD
jgi:uncharacterized protein YbcI